MSKYRIQRYKQSIVLDFSDDDNLIVSGGHQLNGKLLGAIITVPDLDSTNTATFTLKDPDGNQLYQKATIAKETTSINLFDADTIIPLSGVHSIEISTSGAQSANRTFGVALLIER